MKVKLGISTSERDGTLTHVDIVALSTEIAELKDNIVTVSGEIDELDQVICNLQLVRDAVSTNKSPMDAMKMLDCVASVESLLGVAADKITKPAAMEGLGDAIKNTFKKLVEAIKKFFRWIASFFVSGKTATESAANEAVESSKKTAESVTKAVEKFEEIKTDNTKVQELKTTPPEKPSVPEPPKTRFVADPPTTLLLTYNPDPSGRVFVAGDLDQWKSLITKIESVFDPVKSLIHQVYFQKASKTFEEARAKDKTFSSKCTEIIKSKFGDALKVGDGNNGVLVGIIAINDSGKLYPKSTNGTVKTLHWDRSKLGEIYSVVNNFKRRVEDFSKGCEQALAIRRSDLDKYEADVEKGLDKEDNAKMTALKAMKSDAGIVYRVAGSLEQISRSIFRNFSYDCKVVRAAMDW